MWVAYGVDVVVGIRDGVVANLSTDLFERNPAVHRPFDVKFNLVEESVNLLVVRVSNLRLSWTVSKCAFQSMLVR